MLQADRRTRWSLEIVVAALRACRLLALLSLLFTAIALSPWLGATPVLQRAAILLLGLVALGFAVRVAIDEHLFRRMLETGPDLSALDAALGALGWLESGKAGRPLTLRFHGALRLARWQAGLTLLQGLLAVMALSP